MSELLGKIISEQPQNAVDFFEEYSRQLKEKRFKKPSDIQQVYIPPTQYGETTKLIKLFKVFIILDLPII